MEGKFLACLNCINEAIIVSGTKFKNTRQHTMVTSYFKWFNGFVDELLMKLLKPVFECAVDMKDYVTYYK